MSQELDTSIAVIGIDIGKNSFRIVSQNQRGAIVLRQKWSRGQVGARLGNLLEACVGAHHLSRTLQAPRPSPYSMRGRWYRLKSRRVRTTPVFR